MNVAERLIAGETLIWSHLTGPEKELVWELARQVNADCPSFIPFSQYMTELERTRKAQ
jgi:hypothetical protein